jgi:hypothetical protein
MDVSVRDGGKQIEYEDQNPKVHPMYLEALAKHGAKSKMGKFVDETKFRNDPKLKAALAD